MLDTETVDVKHIYTLWTTCRAFNFEPGGTYNYHYSLKLN